MRARKRILAMLLTFTLLLGLMPMTAMAERGDPLGLSCMNHQAHDEDCGYIEAVDGTDCTHEHDGGCGFATPTDASPCTFVHQHDSDCGYDGTDEATCTFDIADHQHDEDCGFTDATEASDCTHEHDENCGFVAAVVGDDCEHTCELCAVEMFAPAAASTDAGLLKVAGLTIAPGSETGTDTDPITAAVTVPNATASITDANVEIATGATAEFYTDSGFTTAGSTTLVDGANDQYIKVTAADTTTALHYHITVTRVAINAPEITTTQADIPEGMKNVYYSAPFTVTGATSGHSWIRTGTLPQGLSFMGGGTEALNISGIPTEIGVFSVIVQYNGNAGKSAPLEVTITIVDDARNTVGFGGKEWLIIGNNESTVSSANMTLFSKNYDFSTTTFGNTSKYSESTLRTRMEETLTGLNLSNSEKELILARDLVGSGDDYTQGIEMAGSNADNQLFWPLSFGEHGALLEPYRCYGSPYWLRSPGGNYYYAYYGPSDGGSAITIYVNLSNAIRPAFHLNLASAIFTSAAAGGKSDAVGVISAAQPPANFYKFTMADDNQTLILTATPLQQAQSGGTLSFDYLGATVGTNQYISCILTSGNDLADVKYYGMLVDCTSGNDSGTLNIPLTGVADGTYTLKIFSEQINADNYTDFCSEPVSMTVTVSGGNGIVSDYPVSKLVLTPVKTTLTIGSETTGTTVATASALNIIGTPTYSIDGTALPAGLSLNPATGEITVDDASALVVGTTTVTVKVEGATYGEATDALAIIVNNAPPPAATLGMSQPANDTAEEGKPYSKTFSVIYSNGTGTLGYSTTSPLPAGISLNPITGVLSGTPQSGTAGSYPITVKVTDGTLSATGSFTLTVTAAPQTPTLTLNQPVNDTVKSGQHYTKTLEAIYTGSGTLTFSQTGLPSSLTLNTSTGVITGTPTAGDKGTHIVNITVDDGSLSDTKSFTLTIQDAGTNPANPTNPTTPSAPDNDNSGGTSTPDTAKPTITEKQPNMPTTANTNVSGTIASNILTISITEQMAQDAIKEAQDAAKKSGKTADGIAVQFTASNTTGYDSIIAKYDRAALERLKEAGVRFVKIGSTIIDLTLDQKAIDAVLSQTTGIVTMSAIKQTKLSDAAKKLIGSRPAFDITITGANGVTVSDLKGGFATIGIAYKTANNGTGSLYAVYVKPNGNIELLPSSSYTNGRLIFKRGSLSVYGVGYKTPAPSFTDTKTHWAREDIEFVVSRGMLSGTSSTAFSPDIAITRATFLMALGKLSDADVSGYTNSSFSDVTATDPAMPYIEWAYQKGIVKGIGDGKFGPALSISRQDMAVMMQNYAKATGYTLPVSLTAVTFGDNTKIAAYAKDAVKAIQQAGIMQGKGSNTFDPTGNTTRAEASVILRRFVELVIDEGTARGWSQNDVGQWRYIDDTGKAVTGWKTIDGQKYFFDVNGIMKTGWHTENGVKYYFDKNGIMAFGKWVQIDKKWYYFYADGKLAVNTTVDGHTVGADGARK